MTRLAKTVALLSAGALALPTVSGENRPYRTHQSDRSAPKHQVIPSLAPVLSLDGIALARRVNAQRASRGAARNSRAIPTLPPAAFPRAASHAKAAPKPPQPTGAGRPARQNSAGSAGPARRDSDSPGRAGLNWSALEDCESSGDPRAVSPSGKYRGLHQFDLQTWRSVGGVGDPIDASPAEQRKRAWLLYLERGRSPWPVCGARL